MIYQRIGSLLVVCCIVGLFKVDQRSGSLLVVGYVVGIYCLRFIKEVVLFWFPIRSLLFIYQRSGSLMVISCIVGHYF